MIALGRPDQRTLADLLARSFVVEGPALPPPADLEEFDEWKAHRISVLVRIGVFEVVLMSSVLALPWLLSSSSGESSQGKIARLKLEALESKFKADPGSESLANDLQREFSARGRDADPPGGLYASRRTGTERQCGWRGCEFSR